jgi:hypothetical protein
MNPIAQGDRRPVRAPHGTDGLPALVATTEVGEF